MVFDNLTEDNFLLYAAKNYQSVYYLQHEFEEDLNRIKYLKRIFKKYKTDNDLKLQLTLNHIILLNNSFSAEPTVRILFFKIEEIYYPILKTFFVYLNIMPDVVKGINGKNIISSDIVLDMQIVQLLREI